MSIPPRIGGMHSGRKWPVTADETTGGSDSSPVKKHRLGRKLIRRLLLFSPLAMPPTSCVSSRKKSDVENHQVAVHLLDVNTVEWHQNAPVGLPVAAIGCAPDSLQSR
jgi:hypothetical protein